LPTFSAEHTQLTGSFESDFFNDGGKMERRDFIRLGLAGAAGSVILPKVALAEAKIPTTGAGGLFYTAEAPGRWAKKAAGHLPNVALEKNGANLGVQVVTSHPMDSFNHYIIKHQLLNANFEYITENVFDPTKDTQPISTFNLEGYSGPLYALSFCNLHDVWVSVVEA